MTLRRLKGIIITNSDGDTVARYSYDAWGKCAVEFDSTGYIADKVSFAISFGVTWTQMYIKFGIGYSPKKSGVFFSLSLTFSISFWVIAGIAIACAAFPVLGSFLGTAITAVKSSVAVATPVLVPLIPKVANELFKYLV